MIGRALPLAALALTCAACTGSSSPEGAGVPLNNAGDDMPSCELETKRFEPILDKGAPPVSVVFAKTNCDPQSGWKATILVAKNSDWHPVFEGPYSRGVQRAGRGGRGHVYRLVRDDGPTADLTYRAPHLVLIDYETKETLQLISE